MKLLFAIILTVSFLYASEETPTKEEVTKLYVATFNRAPDSAGLDYWTNSSKLTLSQIAQSFFEQPEAQTVYPADTSNKDFINSVYENLFNRLADSEGMDYWKSELDKGAISKNRFIEAVIHGAEDNKNSSDAETLSNKSSVALYYAEAGLDDTTEARTIISAVTEDATTVGDANVAVDDLDKEAHSEISVPDSDEDSAVEVADADEDDSHQGTSTDTPVPAENNTTGTTGTTVGAAAGYTLLAWNDLGMHCFDGSDFSVFSILPPYNNLNAQLITKTGTSNKHITTGVTITYEALTNNGHTNTISSTKTNFWDYLVSLFPGATSTNDVGLTGNRAPSTTPQNMSYNATNNWWEADGIPLINRDDNNMTNYYPMVRVVAKDTAGVVLATADVVLPVSDEMNCAKCHASTVTSTDAKPISGWENSADPLKDYKFNILRLHDEKYPINSADLSAVQAKGYTNYKASLYETAKSGTPILCATCHSSNALGTTSIGNAQPLTASLHSKHASAIDPSNGLTLNSSSNRTACYSCHPGSSTQCLRGAMGSAKDSNGNQMMQCQSCHGTMSDVGNSSRIGWLDQPNCQVCHQGGERHQSALVNGSLRTVLDTTFATNPNTPASGVSLYRYSKGHGDLKCSSCHGSTHAIFPTSHAQDNIYSQQIQGHSGTVAECTSCHKTVPSTITGGPHGMHTVGEAWVEAHQDVAERNSTNCKTCHGSDYRGSVLSKTFNARTFKIENQTKTFNKGDQVSCYSCHNGPNG